MKTIDDRFRKGLKRIKPDIDSAKKSIDTAKKHLKDAETTYGIKTYSVTIVSSYEAMFHVARQFFFGN
jgi:uncharacterized protein (UPF0332 family)